MDFQVTLFKLLPFVIYFVSVLLSCIAGILVYTGLSSKEERLQTRIRIRYNLSKNTEKVVKDSKSSKAEEWFKKANYPLGLNGLKYYMIYAGTFGFLFLYYLLFPILINSLSRGNLMVLAIIIVLALLALPNFPVSLFRFLMNKVITYQQARKQSEIFMLYDLVINEIEMMSNNRINTYNMIRNIKPYFIILDRSLTQLLSIWGSDEGPKVALDKFSEELNSKEADALIGVLKNLDDLDRATALNQLLGMNNMFVRSQIENYRRRKKITTDLLGIPIKATHFIIIINFLMVIVTMVATILQNSRL